MFKGVASKMESHFQKITSADIQIKRECKEKGLTSPSNTKKLNERYLTNPVRLISCYVQIEDNLWL